MSVDGSLLVAHANTNGLGPRTEELREVFKGATVISLQDTRLRDGRAYWASEWPDFCVYIAAQAI